jgi:hypothetical protein
LGRSKEKGRNPCYIPSLQLSHLQEPYNWAAQRNGEPGAIETPLIDLTWIWTLLRHSDSRQGEKSLIHSHFNHLSLPHIASQVNISYFTLFSSPNSVFIPILCFILYFSSPTFLPITSIYFNYCF